MRERGATTLALNAYAPDRIAPAARQLRIALVQTQAEGAGAQEIMRILGNGLTACGYDVHYLFLFRRTAAFDTQPNTHFCALERPNNVRSVIRMFRDLVGHLRALQPDVVLTFQHYGNLIGSAAARLAGAAIVANRTSARALEPRWTRILDFAFGITGLFDRIVVNSKSVEDEYKSFPWAYRKRVVRIDHGFAPKRSGLSRGEARRCFELPPNVPLLGSVARLHSQKNLGAAIRLLAERPDWHLALAGQGEQRPLLEAQARELNVAHRVHFLGELSRERVAMFLNSLDVFVFPTRMETFGLAAVEAAQAGVPVVASDIEVMREVLNVDEEPCALFVDPEDTPAFASAVDALLQDGDLSSSLIANSAALEQRYSFEVMVERHVQLIQKIAKRTNLQPSLPEPRPAVNR
jgi:glycosyltransferase involved in cell wall biosynthesis